MGSDAKPRRRSLPIIGRFSFDVPAFIPCVPFECGCSREACVQDTGDPWHSLLKALIESCKLAFRVPCQRRIDTYNQAPLSHEPEMLGFKIAQTLRQQASSNQEHN